MRIPITGRPAIDIVTVRVLTAMARMRPLVERYAPVGIPAYMRVVAARVRALATPTRPVSEAPGAKGAGVKPRPNLANP